eukprot:scaffold2735_cov114-Isochrysis_galbana.AAC.7
MVAVPTCLATTDSARSTRPRSLSACAPAPAPPKRVAVRAMATRLSPTCCASSAARRARGASVSRARIRSSAEGRLATAGKRNDPRPTSCAASSTLSTLAAPAS